MSCIIVVPVYKETLNEYEKISIIQLDKVLKNYPIALVHFPELNIKNVISLFQHNHNIFSVTFPKQYFKSPQTYNRLLTSLKFFKDFGKYDFFLMYHTDAYVFKDELEYWCNKDYDYIGAPIYEYNGTINPPDENYICVGNGGFSLHKVDSAIKVLKTLRKIYPIKDLVKWYYKYNWKGRIKYLPYFLRVLLGFGGNSHHLLNYIRINEDIFWGKYVPEAFQDFKVAPFEEASKFGMEYNCEKLLKLNNYRLPFGCHQWFKREFLNFWKPYINEQVNPIKSHE